MNESETTDAFVADLKAVRKRLKMTQSEFAQAVGVEQATISRWENGIEPTYEKLRLLLAFFKAQNIPLKSISLFDDFSDAETDSVLNRLLVEVPVIGELDANHRVALSNDERSTTRQADKVIFAPWNKSARTVAVDEGMATIYAATHGLIYFFENTREQPGPSELGRLCFAEVSGKGIYLRHLLPGRSRGYFHLLSGSKEPLLDVKVDWAAAVTWIHQL